jgi:hypothetical protein
MSFLFKNRIASRAEAPRLQTGTVTYFFMKFSQIRAICRFSSRSSCFYCIGFSKSLWPVVHPSAANKYRQPLAEACRAVLRLAYRCGGESSEAGISTKSAGSCRAKTRKWKNFLLLWLQRLSTKTCGRGSAFFDKNAQVAPTVEGTNRRRSWRM